MVTLHTWLYAALLAMLVLQLILVAGLTSYWMSRVRRLQVEHAHDAVALATADNLASFCTHLPNHRSGDSFSGTPPHRQVEVSRNAALEKAGDLANTYLLKRGKIKPKVVVPDSAFRELGTTHDHAPEEIKRWKQ